MSFLVVVVVVAGSRHKAVPAASSRGEDLPSDRWNQWCLRGIAVRRWMQGECSADIAGIADTVERGSKWNGAVAAGIAGLVTDMVDIVVAAFDIVVAVAEPVVSACHLEAFATQRVFLQRLLSMMTSSYSNMSTYHIQILFCTDPTRDA